MSRLQPCAPTHDHTDRVAAPPRAIAGPISVLAADRQPLFRDAVTRAVRQRAGLTLSGEAADGWTALELIRERRPTVAVVARNLPGIDGFRLLNAIVRDALPTRVVLVGGTADRAGYDALAAGAAGWLSRYSRVDELCDGIVAAAQGRMALRDDVQSTIAEQIRRRSHLHPSVLSERERDVLRLLADGRSPIETGRALAISTGTVKATLQRLYKRLVVGDRAALVALALRRGWIE